MVNIKEVSKFRSGDTSFSYCSGRFGRSVPLTMLTFFILMPWVSITPQFVQVMPLQTVIDTDTCYILPKGSREMTLHISCLKTGKIG